MKKIYNKFLFAIMILGAIMIIPACGGDEGDDDGGGGNGGDDGGGGNGGGVEEIIKVLPGKIFSTSDISKTTIEFKLNSRIFCISEIYDTISIDTDQYKSEVSTKTTITYEDKADGKPIVTKIHSRSESTGSHLSGVHILEDTYNVSQNGNKVKIELVSSYNSLETSGKGSALGVITLDIDENGRITSRTENWEDGRTSKGTFTYDKNGNMIEDAYTGTTIEGTTYTTSSKYEYDEKQNIFIDFHAPNWFGHLPLPFFNYNEKNNVVRTTSTNSGLDTPYVSTTVYEYNLRGYPISYKNESNMEGEESSEWFVEYYTIIID